MPLRKGSSDKVVGKNIGELERSGRPRAQSIAIAERQAGKAKPRSRDDEVRAASEELRRKATR